MTTLGVFRAFLERHLGRLWGVFMRLYENFSVFRASLGTFLWKLWASWDVFVRLYENLGVFRAFLRRHLRRLYVVVKRWLRDARTGCFWIIFMVTLGGFRASLGVFTASLGHLYASLWKLRASWGVFVHLYENFGVFRASFGASLCVSMKTWASLEHLLRHLWVSLRCLCRSFYRASLNHPLAVVYGC